MIDHIPELIDAGVTSLKIEGRIKSAYYAAVTTYAYRHAIDAAVAGRTLDPVWSSEVYKCSHRQYSTGFYFGDPGQYYPDSMYFSDADVCAVVESCDESGNALCTQRNKFSAGDALELIMPGSKPIPFTAEEIFDENGEPLNDTPHPMMCFRITLPIYAGRLSILRKRKSY